MTYFKNYRAWILFGYLIIFGAHLNLYAADDSPSGANTDVISQAEMIQSQNKQQTQIQETPQIEQVESKVETSPADQNTLLVKKIRFEGNQAISSETLHAIVAEFENQTLSFQRLRDAVNLVSAYYRSHGYLLSRAYLPPQKIEKGEVLIQILEGRPGKISVEGNRWFNDPIYTNYFRNMNSSKTFEYNDLETTLYFLNEKEDRQAKAFLSPGSESGTTDITLKAQEVFPLHMNYEFNNRGTKFTNRARHMLNAKHTNLLGFDDTLRGGLTLAEQTALRAAWLQYTFPVQSTGTEFGLNWSLAKTHLTKDLRENNIQGSYFELSPSITQSIIRRRTFGLSWFAGFEIKDSKSTTAHVKNYFERMRVIRTGPRSSLQDRLGKTFFSADTHIGLGNFMGSLEKDSPNGSRDGTGGSFTYYSGGVTRLQRLPLASYLVIQANGQWSPVKLASLEQFRAGGMTTVRGYSESDSSGDRGYTLSTELNTPIPFLPKNYEIPVVHQKLVQAFRLVGFYDLGETSNRARDRATDEKNRFLMGTGFGFRVNLKEYLNIQMDVGFPIGNESTDKDRPQIHLSVKSGF
jgi:hemolysin activation/secretion protein